MGKLLKQDGKGHPLAKQRVLSRELLDQAHALVRGETVGRRLPDPEEVIAQTREERDADGYDPVR